MLISRTCYNVACDDVAYPQALQPPCGAVVSGDSQRYYGSSSTEDDGATTITTSQGSAVALSWRYHQVSASSTYIQYKLPIDCSRDYSNHSFMIVLALTTLPISVARCKR